MSATEPLAFLGNPASPYTRKMLALLRYRRIPHRVIWGSHMAPPEGLRGISLIDHLDMQIRLGGRQRLQCHLDPSRFALQV